MKNNNQPEIRFPGFIDDWKQCSLSDVGDFIRTSIDPHRNSEAEFVEYSMPSYDNGRQPKHVLGKSMQSLRLKIFGEVLLINKLNVRQKRIWLVEDAPENAVSSSEFMPFISAEINLAFLEQLMLSDKITRDLESISSGTSNSQKRIIPSDLLNYQIKVPIKKYEQQKIGDFFKQLDNAIAFQRQELVNLEQTKQGFLQKMFPKEGKKVPEIRFSGFTEDWELCKFEELLDKESGVRRGPFGSALKKEIFVKESDYVVYEQQNAIYDNYETRYSIPESKFKELSKFILTEGDFIMSGAGTIGRISRVPSGIKQGVFNQALIRFKINNEITDSEYFIQFIRAENMQRKLTGANPGSAITNLVPMSEVKKWDILVPSKKEQQKIGTFFKQLDDTIALHQRELDLLKETKKAFLQKLFV